MKSLFRAIPLALLLTAAGCLDGESGTDVNGPLVPDKDEDNQIPDLNEPGGASGTEDSGVTTGDPLDDPDGLPSDGGTVNPNPPGTDPDLAGARIAPECETIEVPEGSCRRVMCAEADGPVVEMAACNI